MRYWNKLVINKKLFGHGPSSFLIGIEIIWIRYFFDLVEIFDLYIQSKFKRIGFLGRNGHCSFGIEF